MIKPELQKVLRRKFDPIMQHDSHEFMVFLFEQLSDEQTPKVGSEWDGDGSTKRPMQQICNEYM